MRIPTIAGIIDRRMLINYQVDPEVLARLLPAPFEPKLVDGIGMAGICLIRLTKLRPRALPPVMTLGSENAAHRVAVEWTEHGERREGVFIFRRDSASRLNTWLGGRIFPGVHQHARFRVAETDERFQLAMTSDDGRTRIAVDAALASELPASSVFGSLAAASAFFEGGSVGYSPANRPGTYEGIELRTPQWKVEPLAIHTVSSSFFEDARLFPPGSARLDCGLVMRKIEHEWYARGDVCTGGDVSGVA
jgi:hypothetical protein